MIVSVVESDPICAMQACMDGFSVVSCYKDGLVTRNPADINTQVMGDIDLVVTTTGNVNVCDSAMLTTLKNTAVVCNICLLYTSPSPRDRTRSRMPSSA